MPRRLPVRQETAKMLGLSLNNVRVISAGLGGGFGGKGRHHLRRRHRADLRPVGDQGRSGR